MVCGRILWARLGGGELIPMTFHWRGLRHMATPPGTEAGECGPGPRRRSWVLSLAGNCCHSVPPTPAQIRILLARKKE